MKRLLVTMVVATGLLVGATTVKAQDAVEVTAGADLVSSYIWRGQDKGSAAVQPKLGVAYKGISLSAWGSYGIVKDDCKEIDLTLSYTTGGLTVGVIDYFAITDINPDAKYFEYAAHKTSHTFEANLGYDFGPLSVNWFTNFTGADGLNKSGKRAYSSYFELAAPFKLGGLEWNAALGAVPYATTFYNKSNGFAVINVKVAATKEIQITPTFKLPLFAAITANPSTSGCYFTAGISF